MLLLLLKNNTIKTNLISAKFVNEQFRKRVKK